jgi:hypothetical protein
VYHARVLRIWVYYHKVRENERLTRMLSLLSVPTYWGDETPTGECALLEDLDFDLISVFTTTVCRVRAVVSSVCGSGCNLSL